MLSSAASGSRSSTASGATSSCSRRSASWDSPQAARTRGSRSPRSQDPRYRRAARAAARHRIGDAARRPVDRDGAQARLELRAQELDGGRAHVLDVLDHAAAVVDDQADGDRDGFAATDRNLLEPLAREERGQARKAIDAATEGRIEFGRPIALDEGAGIP